MTLKIQRKIRLAGHTTFRIGGQAQYFTAISTFPQLKNVIRFAQHKKIPYRVIGNGSNVLVADRGYKGLIIKNEINQVKTLKQNKGKIIIRSGSGVQLNYLISYVLSKGYTGLHYFSYIPGTVGGAIYNNAHFQNHFIGDFMVSGEVFTPEGLLKRYMKKDFCFGYDRSLLKLENLILVQAVFEIPRGSIPSARQEQKEILRQRAGYPSCSAGCIFQNLTIREQKKAQLEESSTGYLIDKELGFKGFKRGGAAVSLAHAAFIENRKNASANDVLELMKIIRKKAKNKFGLNLRPEIDLIGFTKKELKGII